MVAVKRDVPQHPRTSHNAPSMPYAGGAYGGAVPFVGVAGVVVTPTTVRVLFLILRMLVAARAREEG